MYVSQPTQENLVKHLINKGILKTPALIEAFRNVDRADFLLPKDRSYADEDHPFPIGHGQTNSQPTTVAIMLELLESKKGDRVLDIGAGSCWTTALLAYIVGKEGEVFGVERIPELVKFGRENLKKYNYSNASIVDAVLSPQGDVELGLLRKAPFDKILVSASAREFPQSLLEQLKPGGAIVIPVQNSLFKVTKGSTDDEIFSEEIPGFSFVPLIHA